MFQTVSKRLPHPSKLKGSSKEERNKMKKADSENNRNRTETSDFSLNSTESHRINLRKVTKLYRKSNSVGQTRFY